MIGMTRRLRTKFLVHLIATTFWLMAVGMMTGCSADRATSTLPKTHPPSWTDPLSKDFHGSVASSNSTESCLKCHGDDLSGGAVEISCRDCHLTAGACTACHGGADNNTGAPPRGLEGETNSITLAVGAHTAHVEGSDLAAAVDCGACHLVPVSSFDSSHLDGTLSEGGQPLDSIAEITWQGIADGGQASWNRATGRCTGIYCHGSFAGGNDGNSPNWTGVDQAGCGSCHDAGSNPASLQWKHDFHVGTVGVACNACHARVVDTTLNIIAANLHIDGLVDTLTADTTLCNACHGSGEGSCTTCHGGIDNQTGAPPRGIEGELLSSELAVGAHTVHVSGGILADAFDCTTCHVVPTAWDDSGHLGPDFIAEITWDSLAGANATWDRLAATCNDTYCHGDFSGGNASNLPVWTAADKAGCGSCHDVGSDPASLRDRHEHHVLEEGIGCYQCHSQTVDVNLNIIGRQVHVDGQNDVSFSSGQGTWSNGSCSNTGCHDTEDW